MTEEQEKAFKQAYSDCSSQANEGYVPDRGGFKAGFLAGVRYKESEFKEIQEQWSLQWNDEAAANAAGFNEAFERFQPEIERLKNENAKLREALELIAKPKRPDGTYNRSREACEQLAREALEIK